MSLSLIGIDVGTTATKATMIDGSGRELAQFSRPHDMDRSTPGMAEQSSDMWMDSVLAALSHFANVADLAGLAGIGLTSQVNTHVFVGADGEALRPALTWQDTRPASDALALDAQVTTAQKTAWFGGPVPIDASHALARMAFIARTEPDIWRRAQHVLLPKDFVALQLTGVLAADPMAAVGLVDGEGRYVTPLLDLVPGAATRLPQLFPYHHIVGHVREGLPCAGTPVMVGAMDAWAGMFGCGVIADGDAMYQSGTSEVPGIISSKVVPTPGVILFPPYQGIRLHAAPTQSGGASLTWLSTLLGRSTSDLLQMAATTESSTATPLFLPHLAGERAPIWDATSRGVFARLDAGTGPEQLTLSVLEGVAHSVRWAFEALQDSAGVALDTIRIGGGGARSDLWCQIRADVLGARLERTSVTATAALGAAIIAGVGSGAFPSLSDAVRELVRFDRQFDPDTARHELYNERHASFRMLHADLRAFNQRFGH
ncbi:MAG: FGGY-family carbohydrate kinase [Candidatus Devosia phytovorans]|uniref:FGGY-family carbohydrate kinase n=1 Tax=Candidatus Devosia phytovorans TaxID=3121372 RepID=A0AAJ6B033_9HYPH|nr:FGGY-family carbohydrate kinase [Devosia sp.]WEK03774.1 MAG: FGGY-family carbohydrate kinase [Devosia sp.]